MTVKRFAANIEAAEANAIPLEYGPVSEARGVRRFYLRDPCGKLLHILQRESG